MKPLQTFVPAALLASALAATPVTAAPTNFDYSSLSIALNSVSFDDDVFIPRGGGQAGSDRYSGLTGISVSGVWQVSDNIILSLASSYLYDDTSATEYEETTGSVGIGFVAPIDEAMDFISEFSVISAEVEQCNLDGCTSVDDDGYGIQAGLRRWATPNVEINGSVAYTDLGDFGDTTSVGVGGAYWLTDHSSITGALRTSSDATGVALGYRYTF